MNFYLGIYGLLAGVTTITLSVAAWYGTATIALLFGRPAKRVIGSFSLQ